jgi:Kef-type K+ transport system membrane component KefB
MKSLASSADLTMAMVFAGIAAVLVMGTLLAQVARRLRQPVVIGEITAGIVLGPSVLGLLPGDLTHRLFPTEVRPMLSAVAQVGLLLFMFMIGWEFEKSLLRDGRAAAAAVSFSSVALAFGLGAGLALVLYPQHDVAGGHHIPKTAFCLFLGAAMSITAFPVLARILTDYGIMRTRVASLSLASAAIDDVLAWCLLAMVSAIVTAGDGRDLLQIAALAALYVGVMFAVVRPALAVLVRRLTTGRVSPALLVILVAGVFVSAYCTTWIGIHAIFGAFLLGFVMPREPGVHAPSDVLATHLRRPLDSIGLVLLPVFFIVTGLSVNIGALDARNYLELGAILGVACAGKLIGSVVPARVFGLPGREAWALGLLMNTRGLTELVILNAGLSLGVLDPPMFTMMVLMGLVTTALAGPLLPSAEQLGASPPPNAPAPEPAAETTVPAAGAR